MDEKEQDNVAAFDMLFTTNQIQIMKALLPCFERPMQKYLAIYIKYQELQYTVTYFKNHPYHICSASSDSKADIRKILPTLLPYCNDSQRKKLQQIEQIFSSLETYQEMMEMMEMLKDMGYDPANNESIDGINGSTQNTANDNTACFAANTPCSENAASSEASPCAESTAYEQDINHSQNDGMQLPDMLLSMLSPEQQGLLELLKGGMNHE